ncbi:MAG: IS630 family transposase [Hormoscilla sp. GUM202]|nr:IS630 family transposase [Hormoscilla sp. GUM202]MBO1350552.1 IS630 family transposase [Hormoscilla sp. GUM202]
MREINELSAKLLLRIYHQSRHDRVRQRAHCLLLRDREHKKFKELMEIFDVSYRTIYNWIKNWDSEGMVGLYNKSGRGRKQTFSLEQKEKIKAWTEEEPRQLKKVVAKIKEEWGIETSVKTVQRILKTMNMSWHRMRKGVAVSPPAQEYEEKKAQLEQLKLLDNLGEINLYYLDESGFYLIPCVPYGWQNIGEYIEVPSRSSRRLNVLGIMNRHNHLEAYVSTQNINSDVVIACIDAFFPTRMEKQTVIVVDQASVHTSDAIQDKIEEWKERNITIFHLPTYSPHLNLIEILWRFIKYEWIEIDAYSCWKNLVDSVETIIKNFGEKYVINFV